MKTRSKEHCNGCQSILPPAWQNSENGPKISSANTRCWPTLWWLLSIEIRIEEAVFLRRALDGASRANKSKYVYQIIKIDVQHTVNVLRFAPKGGRPGRFWCYHPIIDRRYREKHHRQEQWRRAICNFLFHQDPCLNRRASEQASGDYNLVWLGP